MLLFIISNTELLSVLLYSILLICQQNCYILSLSLVDNALFKEGVYDNDVEKARTNPSESEGGDGRVEGGYNLFVLLI